MGQHVAYIRVSSVDQNENRQLAGLDIKFDRTFIDRVSGKDTHRPELQNCLAHVREGDLLHVHSIDRLARNMADLLEIVKQLTAKGVAVRFHKEKLEFTGDENPFQNLQLQMLGAFSEFERSMIRERQREGIAAAQAQGKRIGRRPALSDDQLAEAKALIEGGTPKARVAEQFNISRQALHNALKRQ